MTNTELYYNFYEGTLDSVSEMKFMELLRSDESFRTGLKSYVNVTGTINSNIKLFGPSSQETGELYSKLGFTIPVENNIIPAPAASNATFFQNPVFKYILAGVASSFVTLLVAYFLWSPDSKLATNYSSNLITPEK